MERELIGANLRRARQALRLSQTAAAAVLGLSRQAVSASESGKRAITVEELWKAANLYRHPVEWFFKSHPIGADRDLEHVQRRSNAKRTQMLDQHDAYEIQNFWYDSRRGFRHNQRFITLGQSPKFPLRGVSAFP